MQNLINQKANSDDDSELINISKKELKSLYRKIIECEKKIQEFQEKEKKLLNAQSNIID